jgi:hypothetical protein
MDNIEWTPEDYIKAAQAQGFNLVETDDGYQWYGRGPDGESYRWRPSEDSGPYPGDPRSYYLSQLGQSGYDIAGDQLSQYAQRLGVTRDQAAQYIYGPGSQIVSDPRFGELVKAGTFNPGAMNNGWNLPDMQGFGNGFLDNFADSGGIISLLSGGLAGVGGLTSALTPSLTSVGANALVNGSLSAIAGGDPLAGAISGGLGAGLPSAGITDPTLIGAIKGAAGGLISGGDPLQAAVMGATSGYATSALNSLANGLSTSPIQIADSGAVTSDAPPAYAGTIPDMTQAQAQTEFDKFLQETQQPTLPNKFDLLLNSSMLQQPNQPKKEEQAAGGKPVSFFDDLLGDSQAYDPNVDNMDYSQAPLQDWAMQNGVMNPDGSVNWDAFDQLDPYGMGAISGDYGAIPDGESAAGSGGLGGIGGALAKLLLGGGAGFDQIKRLLGGTAAAGADGGLLGGLFGSRGLLGTAASVAPSLAAINYAQNQSPFDTSGLQSLSSQIPSSYNFDTSGIQNLQSQVPNFNVDTSGLTSLQKQVPASFNFDTSGIQNVMNQVPGSYNFDTSKINDVYGRIPTNQSFDTSKLTDAYNQFDPKSVTGQYDLNTAAARQGLASSLSQRGVAGSSFANSDFANFGQQRDVGRQSLINDAITRRAGIANDILSNDKAAAGLNMQGLGLQGQLANNLIGAQQSQAQLGLQGLGLKGQLANNLLGAQQNQAQLGLQGLGLQGQFANQAINAQQQNNAQNLQGLGLKNSMAQSLLDNQYKTSALGLQGQGLQRNIFGDILNAQIASQKNKNDLYGRALLALSGGLSSKSAGIF